MPERVTLESLNLMINDLGGKIGVFNDRLRLIEERSHQNREKVRVLEENLIIKFKDLREDVKRLSLEADENRKVLTDVTKTLQRMVKEVSNSAKISDIAVIDKVLDFFDPTRFLTEKDVNRIISERLRE